MSDEKEELLKLIGKFADLKLLQDFASTMDEIGTCTECGKMVELSELEVGRPFSIACLECRAA